MAVRDPADIRNVALAGQAGAGKTTLSEQLLHQAGVIPRVGTVEEGSTLSDWTEAEREHKHSLRTSTLHFDHEGHMVNLVDTPGMADFLGHTIAVFPAVETVAVVVDAHKGPDSVTRRLMAIAAERNLPRMLIINKIDDPDADLEALTERLRELFGAACLPINLPTPDRKDVVNVFEHDGTDKAGDEALFSSVGEAHQRIIEQIVEVQDELMTKYLDAGEEAISGQKLHDAFEQALRESHLVPICYCSAKTGAGVQDLMHIFASLLPNPLEGNPRPFLRRKEGVEGEVSFAAEPDAGKATIAHVFKVSSDPFVGKLGVFRVHQGTLKAKSEILIGDHKKPIRIGHLFKRQGKENQEVEALGPGDIGAVAKIEEVHFDAVLHEGHELDTLHLKPLPLPKPMYGLAIELKNHADETKFSALIPKLTAEDPCLTIERIAATKQTVMRGLGELHLRIVIERLKADHGIELVTAPPRVAYKETITGKAEGHHRHKKQTGGAGQFGEVYLRVEPLPPEHETGFEFVNETVGGSIPRQFMPAIEKGVRLVLADGAVAGYPLTGVRVSVYDGKYHDVDSKEIAFITAGKRAFIDAIKKAHPVLLEPFVDLEIVAPESYMGDLSGVLSTKRGRVVDTAMGGGGGIVLRAQAPLGELQNFTTELKSITHGAGSFAMDYSHDEPTPPHVQQEVINAYQPHHDED
ncbi:MAG: elongation factor G [Phycisphaerales bacterium]|nr:MAG: elongation factor G [Phycisphaerales bacterium]